jgi:hypothetical protein
VYHEVFTFVLCLLTQKGLIKGKKLGIDASTMEANAALKTRVRRYTGKATTPCCSASPLAKESGIATPTKEDLIRFDRKRKDKTLSNKDWKSPVNEDSRIAKLKDGRTHLAYKPEHVVDLDSGSIVSAKIHQADQGDTTIMHETLADARSKLKTVLGKAALKYDHPAELAADKGYHSREMPWYGWTASFAAGFASLSAGASPAGTAMLKHNEQSTTTGAGYNRQEEKRCNAYVLSAWSEVSPTALTV